MRYKIGWVFLAHHKNLIFWEGGRIAATVHKLWKSVFPKWKQLGWPRWDINLSWEGHYSGKMRLKIGWEFFAHHKNLIMGVWKSVFPKWKQLGWHRWEKVRLRPHDVVKKLTRWDAHFKRRRTLPGNVAVRLQGPYIVTRPKSSITFPPF